MQTTTCPYRVLALSHFSAIPDHVFKPVFYDVDSSVINEVVQDIAPNLIIPIDKEVCPSGCIRLNISTISNFKPKEIVRNVPYLKELMDVYAYLGSPQTQRGDLKIVADQVKAMCPALPIDLKTDDTGSIQNRSAPGSTAIDDILSMVATPDTPKENPLASGGHNLKSWRVSVSDLISSCMNFILSDPLFKKTESAWRGLELMLKQGGMGHSSNTQCQIGPWAPHLMDELAIQIRSMPLHMRPNIILIDAGLTSSALDMERLEAFTQLAAALQTPVAIGISPLFFKHDNWQTINKLPYLPHFFEEPGFEKWQSIRRHIDAQKVCIIGNGPFGRNAYPEDVIGKNLKIYEEDRPTVSAIWGLGGLISQSMNVSGWPTRVTDYTNIQLTNLPVFETGTGQMISTETLLSEDRIGQWISAGITPVVSFKNQDIACIPGLAAISGHPFSWAVFDAFIQSAVVSVLEGTLPDAEEMIRAGSLNECIEKKMGLTPENKLHIKIEKNDQNTELLTISITPDSRMMQDVSPRLIHLPWPLTS